jgi:hypothetical protein
MPSTENEKEIDYKVAGIIDKYRVVINRGSEHGIEQGQRFLILNIGDELFDPDTGESLGCVEVIKGKGEVTHVQERIATLQTTDTHEIKTKPFRKYGMYGVSEMLQSTVVEQGPKAFIDPEIGDIARPI